MLGRLGGPEELGRYALALAVVMPIMVFAGFQTRQLQVADPTNRFAFEDYFAVRLISIGCASVIVLAIASFLLSRQAHTAISPLGIVVQVVVDPKTIGPCGMQLPRAVR